MDLLLDNVEPRHPLIPIAYFSIQENGEQNGSNSELKTVANRHTNNRHKLVHTYWGKEGKDVEIGCFIRLGTHSKCEWLFTEQSGKFKCACTGEASTSNWIVQYSAPRTEQSRSCRRGWYYGQGIILVGTYLYD